MMQTERSTYIRFEVATPLPLDYTLTVHGLHFMPLLLQQNDGFECLPDKEIQFGKDSCPDEILSYGWAGKNHAGVWSDGYESALLFKPTQAYVPSSMQFELSPFHSHSWPAEQKLLIQVNGRHAAQLELRSAQSAIIEIVPEDLVRHQWLQVRFIVAPLAYTRYLAASGIGTAVDHTILAFTLANPSCGVIQAVEALSGANVSGADLPITEELIRQTWSRYELTTFQKRLKAVAANAAFTELLAPLAPRNGKVRTNYRRIGYGHGSCFVP